MKREHASMIRKLIESSVDLMANQDLVFPATSPMISNATNIVNKFHTQY